jgi:hypothetical protein
MFMKKVILLAAATVIATVSFSQVRLGVQVIGNASSVSASSNEVSDLKEPMVVGFGAGLSAALPLQNNLSLRSSLNFLQKKSKVEFATVAGKTNTIKSSLNYLELPVNLVYSVPLNGMSVYFGAGPSVGYGIGGKIKYQGYLPTEGGGSVAVNESTDAFKKEDKGGAGFKRFEISANANAGVQFDNGIYLNAGYLAGLNNIGDKESKYKNGGIMLTLGFLLP